MDRSESGSFALVDLDDAPAQLHSSPFARIGESLFRREFTCDAETQTEGKRKRPKNAVKIAFAGMFVALVAVAGLTSVILHQQRSNAELERRIVLQSERIRELEAKVATMHSYTPMVFMPNKKKKQESTVETCWFEVKLGPCGMGAWNQLVDATEEIVKDLGEVKEMVVDVVNAFASRLRRALLRRVGAGKMAHPIMVKVVFTGAMLAAIYRSLKALKSKNKEYDVLVFWVVYAMLCVFEDNFEFFVRWVPFYFFLKFYFIVAICIPQTKIANLIFYALIIPGIEFLHKQLQHWQPPPLMTILLAPLLLMIQIVFPMLGQPEPEQPTVYKPLHGPQTPPPKPRRPSHWIPDPNPDEPPNYAPPPVPTRRRKSGSSLHTAPLQTVLESEVFTSVQTTVYEPDGSVTQYTETSDETYAVYHQEPEDAGQSPSHATGATDASSALPSPVSNDGATTPAPQRKTRPPRSNAYHTPRKSEADRARLIQDSARRLTEFSLNHQLRTPSSHERELDDEELAKKQPLQRKNALSPESLRDSVATFMDLSSPSPNTLARRQTRQHLMQSNNQLLPRTDRGIPNLTASQAAPQVRQTRTQQLRDFVLRRRNVSPPPQQQRQAARQKPQQEQPISPTPSSSSDSSKRSSRRFSLSRKNSGTQDDKQKKRAWL